MQYNCPELFFGEGEIQGYLFGGWELFSKVDCDLDGSWALLFYGNPSFLKVLGGVTLETECVGEVISL